MPTEASVRPVVVVEVLPLTELLVEECRVVDHHPVKHPVELLLVDSVRALDLAVEPGGTRLDVDVLNPSVQDVPVEARLELRAVVGLDDLHPEGQTLEDVVDELDRRLLVQSVVDLQYPEPRAIIDGGELVVALPGALQRRDELHIDLDPVPG